MARKRAKTFDCGALAAIESGVQEIRDLAEEMREWFDNMPENLQGSDRGTRVEEAADTLEQFDESLFSNLSEAIETCEGKPEVPGCPKHVLGEPCSVCKWNGKPSNQRKIVPLTVVEDPKPEWEEYSNVPSRWVTVVARYGSVMFAIHGSKDPDDPNPQPSAERLEAERKRAREFWEREYKPIIAQNEKNKVPPERRFVAALDPIEDFQEKLEALKVTLPVGKKRQSRADRLDTALSSLRAGVDEIQQMIEDMKGDQRVEAVSEALEELVSGADDVDGVEFPGMYG